MISVLDAQKDKVLFDKFIEENLKLVWMVINRKYSHVLGNIKCDDYFQVGCIGLINATKRYDPEFGAAFSTYAISMITGEMQTYYRDIDSTDVKVSRTAKDIFYRYSWMSKEGKCEDDICKELDISSGELKMIINSMVGSESLDKATYSDEDGKTCSLMDTIASDYNLEDDSLNEIETNEKMSMIKDILTKREFRILTMRLEGMKQPSIAKVIGVSQTRICRILKKIIQKCKKINECYDGVSVISGETDLEVMKKAQ